MSARRVVASVFTLPTPNDEVDDPGPRFVATKPNCRLADVADADVVVVHRVVVATVNRIIHVGRVAASSVVAVERRQAADVTVLRCMVLSLMFLSRLFVLYSIYSCHVTKSKVIPFLIIDAF